MLNFKSKIDFSDKVIALQHYVSIVLISAGNGPICAWKWKEILDKSPRIVWSFSIPKR